MRNYFIFSGFFLLVFSQIIYPLSASSAADDEIPVKSSISAVTVFLTAAQVTQTASITIPAGNSNLKFEDLPQNIDKNSIQVKGGGNFTILSVMHQVNYLKDQQKPKDVQMLEDSLKSLQKLINQETNFQQVLAEEESLLTANKSIGNKEIGVDALDLEEMANFFRKRLSDIRTKQLESREKVVKYTELSGKIGNQLSELSAKHNRPTSEIIVGVSSKAKAPAKLQLSYLVYNSGWTPVYDIRSTAGKNISLVYKANVYQNTGLDWNNVNITLSTGNPVQSGIRPDLRPWILQFRQPVVYYGTKNQAMYKGDDVPQLAQQALIPEAKSAAYKAAEIEQAQTVSSFTQMTESQIATEFIIGIPYTIPSDGKAHLVEIQTHNLHADFRYYSAPKIDKDAFLLARIKGWEDLNLLPGEANIFNEETYVGKSFLSTGTSDTLELSFGRDKSVAVKRTAVKDFTSKKIIGSNKTETHAWEIEVRNTKKDSIEIVIEDQIPLSSDKEITVEALDKGNGLYDEITGKLHWKMKFAPAETKKVKFMFSVKYPKDKFIPGL